MKSIRFSIAQINPTVGNLNLNTEKIRKAILTAKKAGSDCVLFPEMAISGYPIWDLANKQSFIDACKKKLSEIVAYTKGKKIAVGLGYIQRLSVSSHLSQNSFAWIENGKLVVNYAKRLLPTYDVFLERVFFQPGDKSQVVNFKGHRLGLTICEDIWDLDYPDKPLRDLSRKKVDLVVNISASPYYRGVSSVREHLVSSQAKRYKFPIVYVNQVCGQDDLIFDGSSLAANEKGEIFFSAPAFQEGVYTFDWTRGKCPPDSLIREEIKNPIAEVYEALVFGLRDYCKKNNFSKVVIGLSGGIDSALVAALASDALGPKAVLGITMPSKFSSQGSWKDSQDLATRLGITCVSHPIYDRYNLVMNEQREYKKSENRVRLPKARISSAEENLQARLRGLELMYISNDQGRLLLTTGNKSELAMGYCTLYGDMAGGLSVIGDVYKTDVYRLALYRNQINEVIPQSIIHKAPSAELRPNQKDTDSLPPYEILDDILYHYIEENISSFDIETKLRKKYRSRLELGLTKKIIRQVDHNEYKRRQLPPVLRVTRKAWFGRRMPITNHFEG